MNTTWNRWRQARRQEEERNNQQLLFDIEMEKLTEYYEEKIAGMTNQYNGIIAGRGTARIQQNDNRNLKDDSCQ